MLESLETKRGMTQIFTDDGLCVPVTVIAVKDGNYVSAVRLSFLWNFIFSAAKRGTLQGKMVAVCILRARILRARLVRGGLKPIQKRINSFVTSTSFRECQLSSSRVRSRDGFQPLVSSEKEGDFLLLLSPSCLKPSFFLFFSLSFFSFSKGKRVNNNNNN